MMIRTRALTVWVLLASAGTAFAHGGNFQPPQEITPSGPKLDPGTTDPPGSVTRWETWWANNKDYYLRFARKVQAATRVVTPKDQATSKGSGSSAPEDPGVLDTFRREELVALFLDALRDGDPEVRSSAAIALGKSGSERATKPLRKRAEHDPDEEVRDAAILGLGLLGNEADVPYLDGVLGNPRAGTQRRSFAAFALGLIGGDGGTASLSRFLGSRTAAISAQGTRRHRIVGCAVVGLGLTGDPGAVPTLRSLLRDPKFTDTLKPFVLLSLGRLADEGSRDSMVKAIADGNDAGMRRAAAIALGRVTDAGDVLAVEALLRALQVDKDPVTRQFAAISLGRVDDQRVRDALFAMLNKGDARTRPFAAVGLGLQHDRRAARGLEQGLALEKLESLKSSYCIALALIGHKESAELIRGQIAAAKGPWLKGYAALSLGMLGHEESKDFLWSRLQAELDPRVQANLAMSLALLGEERLPAYLTGKIRAHRNAVSTYTRGYAAVVIGTMRLERAIPSLVEIAKDRNLGFRQDDVWRNPSRAFAIVALGNLADPSPMPKLTRFAIDNDYAIKLDPLNQVLRIL